MTLPRSATSSVGRSDRRLLPDRRAVPTTLASVLRPGGRRRALRRSGEERRRYVDAVAPATACLAVAIVVLSSLDALLTLLHIERGGWEVNPVMRYCLELGLPVFLGVKTFGTGLAVIFLALHQTFPLSWLALRGAALVYVLLLGYHLYLAAL